MPVVATALSPARRTFLRIWRWVALGLAIVSLAGPLDSTFWLYRHYSGKVITPADILEARLAHAGSKGMGATYDLYVRYQAGGREIHHNVSVTASVFSTPKAGDKIDLFVDPKTFDAEDDIRTDSWIMVLLGAAAAAVLVAGFVGIGRKLSAAL